MTLPINVMDMHLLGNKADHDMVACQKGKGDVIFAVCRRHFSSCESVTREGDLAMKMSSYLSIYTKAFKKAGLHLYSNNFDFQ